MRCLPCLLAGLTLMAGAGRLPAQSPLRLVPADTDLLLQVHDPRQLLETVRKMDTVQKLQELEVVKELLDSTTARRFFQILAHFEKQLKTRWPELLDGVAGGGALVSAQFGNNAPALFVVQGKDAALTERFLNLALSVLQDEIARQGSKEKLVRATYQRIQTISLGKDLHVAVVDGAIVLSNRMERLKSALDLHTGKSKKGLAQDKRLDDAARILPQGPLVTLWINMDTVRKQPGAEELYKTPRNPFLTILAGHYIDVVGRSPYLCAGLYLKKDELFLTFRVPRGREGMGADRLVGVPAEGESGSRPLLEPKDVLFSYSFYWDVSKFWTERFKLFPEQEAKQFEKADEEAGKVLSNIRPSRLLQTAGTYHRIVAVNQKDYGYKKRPRTPLPAFAVISEMRDPKEFTRSVETILRAVALGNTSKFGLKMVEEKYKGCEITAYRFTEDKRVPEDPSDLRLNFVPCFVRVGKSFVVSSSLELCRELIDLLQAEEKSKNPGVDATSQIRVYPKSGVEFLKNYEEELVTQFILGQALSVPEAREQVQNLFGLLGSLGGLETKSTFAPRQTHFDIRLKLAK